MASKSSSWERARARVVSRVRRWARRRIIVNPGYQLRTLLPIAVYTVALALLLGGLALFPLHRDLNAEPDPDIQAILQDQLFQLHLQLWPMLLFAAFLAAVYALLRSNYVAGPLYRLSLVLERMGEGDYRGARFRQGDEFREFEAITNHLAKKMQALSNRNRDILVSVENRVKQLVQRLNEEDLPNDDLQQALDGILAQLDKARERAPVSR